MTIEELRELAGEMKSPKPKMKDEKNELMYMVGEMMLVQGSALQKLSLLYEKEEQEQAQAQAQEQDDDAD